MTAPSLGIPFIYTLHIYQTLILDEDLVGVLRGTLCKKNKIKITKMHWVILRIHTKSLTCRERASSPQSWLVAVGVFRGK